LFRKTNGQTRAKTKNFLTKPLFILPFSLGFEQSPFKLTPEFVDVIGGHDSELFNEFRKLLVRGLKAARKQQDRIVNVVEIMRSSKLSLFCTFAVK
jgi:Phosphatidylinositol 3- and 4-kinase